MPEIAEVARIVHFLRKNLTNRRIASILTTPDDIVFNAKATPSTTADSFTSALTGKTVLDARQQGKYFWLIMDSPPHALFHLGMTGWMKFSNEETMAGKETKVEGEESEAEDAGKTRYGSEKNNEGIWPPKFWKFVLKMEGSPACEAAFVDARRLARIRLVDAAADAMRQTTPLKENGPDPVIDKDVLTPEWLKAKLLSKKVPVKALLLDQAIISGVGNWVADEVLYHAHIHPEQYSNTFSDEQMKQLHESLQYVTTTACNLLADSSRFPKEWLFKHRWDKGKKDETKNVMPSGEKIVHLKVGGRTSAIVPSVQKKTGPVAGDVEEGADGEIKTKKQQKAKPLMRKAKREEEIDEEEEIEEESESKKPKRATPSKRKVKEEEDDKEIDGDDEKLKEPKSKKTKATSKPSVKTSSKPTTAAKKENVVPKEKDATANGTNQAKRKSARLSGA